MLDVIDTLRSANVRYAVVGAMAAAVLESRLRSSGLQTELRHGDPDDPIAAVLGVSDSFGNRVDLVVGVRGFDPAAFGRAIQVPFQQEKLCVVGREDFIAMKLFAHGPQDLADAECALAAARESIDVSLLERLAERYGAETLEALRKLLMERKLR